MAIRFPRLTISMICFATTSIAQASGNEDTLTQKIRNHSSKKQVELPIDTRAQYAGETVVLQLSAEKSVKVAARTLYLEQYPCTNCHNAESRPTLTKSEDRRSHWHIDKKHPTPGNSECNLCHASDTDMSLKSLTGTKIEFDHSYNLCSQCHSGQFKDWRIGAHGKRLTGWADERVMQNCTGCHNPHDPKFKQKQPATHTIITPLRK